MLLPPSLHTAGVLCSESPGVLRLPPAPESLAHDKWGWNHTTDILLFAICSPVAGVFLGWCLFLCCFVYLWDPEVALSGDYCWVLAPHFALNYYSTDNSSKIWYFSFLLISKIVTLQKCFLSELGNVVLVPRILASSKNSRSNGKTTSIIYIYSTYCSYPVRSVLHTLIRVEIVFGAGRDFCAQEGRSVALGFPFTSQGGTEWDVKLEVEPCVRWGGLCCLMVAPDGGTWWLLGGLAEIPSWTQFVSCSRAIPITAGTCGGRSSGVIAEASWWLRAHKRFGRVRTCTVPSSVVRNSRYVST